MNAMDFFILPPALAEEAPAKELVGVTRAVLQPLTEPAFEDFRPTLAELAGVTARLFASVSGSPVRPIHAIGGESLALLMLHSGLVVPVEDHVELSFKGRMFLAHVNAEGDENG
jgi:hypothetical protein